MVDSRPGNKSDAVGEVILRIAYQGDVARLYAGKRLITDDFYHGAPWEIGLRNIPAADLASGDWSFRFCPCARMRRSIWQRRLAVLFRQDAPRQIAAGTIRVAQFQSGGVSGNVQTARLIDVKVVPYYRATAELGP